MRQIRLICGGPPMPEGFIPPHGGYENLLSYRKAEIVYDATVKFCDRFIDKKSRTHDQMVQAARRGNKNIAEGICLIHQTNYLLDQQLRQLEKAFLQEGGLRERMTRARLAERARQNQPVRTSETAAEPAKEKNE